MKYFTVVPSSTEEGVFLTSFKNARQELQFQFGPDGRMVLRADTTFVHQLAETHPELIGAMVARTLTLGIMEEHFKNHGYTKFSPG